MCTWIMSWLGAKKNFLIFFTDKPKFIENPGEKVTVVEGKSTAITVKARGNPDEITYKWSKNGASVTSAKGKVAVDGANLNFTDVRRKDKGKYEVEAGNKEGTSSISVELDVQCKFNAYSIKLAIFKVK